MDRSVPGTSAPGGGRLGVLDAGPVVNVIAGEAVDLRTLLVGYQKHGDNDDDGERGSDRIPTEPDSPAI